MSSDVPIACSLSADAMQGQVADWDALLSHVMARAAIDSGVRLEMAADVPMHELVRLVTAEQACCQFLGFAITVDTRGIGLEIRGPHDAQSIIGELFGTPA